MKSFLLLLLFLLSSCSTSEEQQQNQLRKQNKKGEYIYRMHDESLFKVPPPIPQEAPQYPWEKGKIGDITLITKEYFRCKGSHLNPDRLYDQKNLSDCGGAERHSLPIKEGSEFIYPILIDLLNNIQSTTQKRVVITSGHRCPEHNLYVDPSLTNQSSKHMIGAEVSFYVQGLEQEPETVVQIIKNYYLSLPEYKDKPLYTEFKRYEKNDTDVSIQPWYNQEIFIKQYQRHEGRNFDNRHPYPYITIQVRYDKSSGERVLYSWDKAHKGFLVL